MKNKNYSYTVLGDIWAYPGEKSLVFNKCDLINEEKKTELEKVLRNILVFYFC